MTKPLLDSTRIVACVCQGVPEHVRVYLLERKLRLDPRALDHPGEHGRRERRSNTLSDKPRRCAKCSKFGHDDPSIVEPMELAPSAA